MKKLIFALLLMCFPGVSLAGDYFITPKISTLGPGVDVGYQLNGMFKIRLNANYLSYSREDEISEVEYDADLSNLTIGLLGDWHPWENGFRFSAGLYYMNFNVDIDGSVSPTATYSIGDNTYTGAQLGTVSGDVDWNPVVPYIGLGWGTDGSSDSGWAFSCDLGAIYIGSAKINYSATGAAADPVLAADIEREKDNIENDLDGYQWYPVLALGITYRF